MATPLVDNYNPTVVRLVLLLQSLSSFCLFIWLFLPHLRPTYCSYKAATVITPHQVKEQIFAKHPEVPLPPCPSHSLLLPPKVAFVLTSGVAISSFLCSLIPRHHSIYQFPLNFMCFLSLLIYRLPSFPPSLQFPY